MLKSKPLLNADPEWEATFRQLAAQARDLKPNVRLKPRTIAREAGIPAWQALAILRLLEEEHLGEVRLQLRDPRRGGMELATFKRIDDIPDIYPDRMGDPLSVTPEDIQVVFVPRSALEKEKRNDEQDV